MWKIILILFVMANLIWIVSQNSVTHNFMAAAFQASAEPIPTPLPQVDIPIYNPTPTPTVATTPTPKPAIEIKQPQDYELLKDQSYVYQTYNNCGPATLSMLLDFYGINATQQEIANQIRPYNNPQGFNDDKSVTLDELGSYAEQKGLTTFKRPNGDLNKLKLLVANGIPVITITWIEEKGGFGHYRIVKGYDEKNKQIIQDDSIFGQDQKIGYDEFMKLWQVFNYDYLVIVPTDKVDTVNQILGEESNSITSYQKAIERSEKETPNIYTQFNKSVSFYYLGDYGKAIQNFEPISSKLLPRLLWYQIEPIQAYQKLKIYDQVFALTDFIFRSGNPSASELYQIRGESYLEQGNKDLAKKEFEKAVLYNKNNFFAIDRLKNL